LPIPICALPIISQGSDVRWQCDKLITASPRRNNWQLGMSNGQWALRVAASGWLADGLRFVFRPRTLLESHYVLRGGKDDCVRFHFFDQPKNQITEERRMDDKTGAGLDPWLRFGDAVGRSRFSVGREPFNSGSQRSLVR
jgi:hypothetical protein